MLDRPFVALSLAVRFLTVGVLAWAISGASFAANTCEQIMACMLDTGQGFAPVSACDQCSSSPAEITTRFQRLLTNPSLSSGCATANDIKWLKDTVSGPVGSITQLYCAAARGTGNVGSLDRHCNAECSSHCNAVGNLFDYSLRNNLLPMDPEEYAAAKKQDDGCLLKCGCGLEKLVCEQGSQVLARKMCSSLGIAGQTAPAEKLDAGRACANDTDCKSQACARGSAADGAGFVCCTNTSALYAGYYYCRDMSKGSRCWSDHQCASGNCKGNMGGLQRGRCG